MADPTRMRAKWDVPGAESYALYEGVVRHLESVLGPVLSLQECVALIPVLDLHDFRCADGFAFGMGAGFDIAEGEAAEIGACFVLDAVADARLILEEYKRTPKNSEADELWRMVDEMMTRILADGSIQLSGGDGRAYHRSPR